MYETLYPSSLPRWKLLSKDLCPPGLSTKRLRARSLFCTTPRARERGVAAGRGQQVGNNWRKEANSRTLDRDFCLRPSADYGNDVTALMDTRACRHAAK